VILIIQVGSFIAAAAAILAGVLMANVTKKFGTGILAYGFKTISFGIFVIAAGIVVDAITSFYQIDNDIVFVLVVFLKYALLVAGTYIIVNGSKRTGDKLESLTK